MIKKIDHMVITTNNIEEIIPFYEKIGFTSHDRGDRFELFAGDFKINVHILGKELLPCAENVQIGCNDFCFEIDVDIDDFYHTLLEREVKIELGIVKRHGVRGEMQSIYLRDPDGNLIEFSSYATTL